MVATPIRHNIKWMTPAPLWSEQGAWIRLPRQTQGLQPRILRFANDTFMEELLAMLNHAPWRLTEWEAQSETWREPMPSPQPIVKTRPERNLSGSYNKTKLLFQRYSKKEKAQFVRQVARMPASQSENVNQNPIKLYQAAHQRHYLVAASLVREESGYPDYLPDISNNENASFIVRALVPRKDKLKTVKKVKSQQPVKASPETYDEYAYVITSAGMAWRKVDQHDPTGQSVQRLAPNEEQLPLFPVAYSDGCGRFRQIMGGLIPVGKREEWYGAPEYDDNMDESGIANFVPANEGGIDHYKQVLYNDVIGPWKALIEQAVTVQENNNESGKPFPGFTWEDARAKLDKARIVRTTRDEIQTGSWYVLLDLAQFLHQHLPRVWDVLTEEKSRETLNNREKDLLNALHETKINTHLFLDLAIENLTVGGFVTGQGQSLWDRLLDLWRLEIYLKLARVLYESDNYSKLLVKKAEALEEKEDIFKGTFRAYFKQFQTALRQSFLDFAKMLGDVSPEIKKAAIGKGKLYAPSNEWHLRKMLREISVPVAHRYILRAIESETSGVIEIDKSLWDILSTFWTIEEYFDPSLGADIANSISEYLHAHDNPILEELDEEVLSWFYGGSQGGDWYSFLDFANDLEKNCPALQVAALFEAFNKQSEEAIDDQTKDLKDTLKQTEITKELYDGLYYYNKQERKIRFIHSLAAALVEVYEWDQDLESVTTPYDRSLQTDEDYSGIDEQWQWPDFLFPLADPSPGRDPETDILPVARTTVPPIVNNDLKSLKGIELPLKRLDAFADLVDALIPKDAGQTAATSDINFQPFLDKPDPNMLKDQDPPKVRFVVRCVFERPNCGVLFPPVISMATCQLEMARFFDPDAPARPVRITMPLDISPAGLRKYKKNAMFLISDMLCGKIKKIKKLTLADLVLSVLPWPFHKDLPNIGKTGPCKDPSGLSLGMFCSLSIPIVTLCALILMIIMVNLFNIFFKWIPYLFVCFPLPGLKGKKD